MAVAPRESRRFEASSPVTRYWLANCAGFSLAGGGRGRVERVLADDDPYAPSMLEVRIGRRRRRRVPTSAVVAVVPSERLLVVSAGGDFAPPWLSRTLEGLGQALRLLERTLRALRLLERAARPHLKRLVVHLLRLAGRAGVEATRLVRSLPWRRSGHFVRSAMTKLWQARSRRSSRPRTTSSAKSSGESSRNEARTTSST